ncbi:MAG: Polyhydroxyalkanoic acid synthase [Myxococcaceae bacterium]|nr:Polyhydroxyalkanoic acid synthase [Myxococcaceae bacterium]
MMAQACNAPTPRDTLYRDGRGSVFRFRPGPRAPAGEHSGQDDREERATTHVPVLLVPSMLHQWYVLDLCEGGSVAAALSNGTPWETFCFDWGVPEDEDRYVEWDDIVARLERAVRFVQRSTGSKKVALVGYSMGATLAAIYAALHPDTLAALVNIAGPIDFSDSGRLGAMVDPRWFDAEAIASAGNISAQQMQAGFLALRPNHAFTRWVRSVDEMHDTAAQAATAALEAWASDTIPFPAAAYVTYIQELYQENRLVRGEHFVAGERIDLARIDCPHLSVVADRDGVCPASSTTALGKFTSSTVKDVLVVPGGHVGAVTGADAATELYPRLVAWLTKHATRPAAFPRLAPESRL